MANDIPYMLTVKKFSSSAGIYYFEHLGLNTDMHAHPADEYLFALKGTFQIATPLGTKDRVTSAFVPRNTLHQINSEKDIIMESVLLEHRRSARSYIPKDLSNLNTIQYGEALLKENWINKIAENACEFPFDLYDPRVSSAIQFMENHPIAYIELMASLENIINLSQSRLSHLFKVNVGVSIKKYLLWTKLKKTLERHMESPDGILASLLDTGFYDQPHFNRTFKDFMGVSPVGVYGSRFVQ